MSALARIALLVSVPLLAACQLPSLHEARKPKAASKKAFFAGASEVESDWEPPLPGGDVGRGEALAYAVREVLVGLSPEQRLAVLATLAPMPVSIERIDSEAAAAEPKGMCGDTSLSCAGPAERESLVLLPVTSRTPLALLAAAAAHQRHVRWAKPTVVVRDELPGVILLAGVLKEMTWRLGSEELAVAALLLGPDIERRIEQSRAKSLTRVWGWLPSKRQPLIERTREAVLLAQLYSLSWPVSTRSALTSAFGYRIHPVYGTLRLHKGVDIAVAEGTEIRAPAPATVRKAREDGRSGKWLELDHGNGIATVFCHASELKAHKGKKVAAGEVIALSGQSGVATGPHLHYQLHLKTVAVDPLRFRAATAESLLFAGPLTAAGGAP